MLEEKLKKLKFSSNKMGARQRIRRGFGKGISSALDRASRSIWDNQK